jgi:alpha-1,4-digalacturonate transport system permease protein
LTWVGSEFFIVAKAGWVSIWWAVLVPKTADAFEIFMARQVMFSILEGLIDAAGLDEARGPKYLGR